MGRTTVRTISRVLIIGIVATTATIALTGTSWADGRTYAAEEMLFSSKINGARRTAGLGRLTVNLALTGVARDWSGRMAADGRLYHNPKVASQVKGDWTRLGENVGVSTRPSTTPKELVDRLHAAFMDSPGHRANILGDFNQVGVGVRMAGDSMWVTVNFTKAKTVVSNNAVSEAGSVAREVFAPARLSGRQAAYAVVAASNQAAHAMGAAALAGDKGPLLYTHPANKWDESPVLHPATRTEIDRALGGRGLVYVVGNTKAVSAKAVRELVNDGYTVKRLSGKSVPATLVNVANETIRRRGNNGRVVIGSTRDWGSNMAAAVWSAKSGTPFLVTSSSRLHPAVAKFLANRDPARRYVVGSRTSISREVQVAAKARRVGGGSRAAVSVNVAKTLWGRTGATDGDRWTSTPGYKKKAWAITLAHAPWSAVNNGPALLMRPTEVPTTVRRYLSWLSYGAGVQGSVRAATPVPRPVVNRVQSLVGAR